MRKYCLVLATLLLLSAGSFAVTIKSAGVTIDLSPSVSSPQFIGTSITWTATVHSPFLGHTFDYQFAVISGNQYQIVRDYNTPNTFTWVPHTVEGTYRIAVTVRDITTQPYTIYPQVMQQFVILPYVTVPGGSAVHPTSHPLVALFSGPPCQSGHSLLVRFHQPNSNTSMTTNSVPCSASSANFYVAGMFPSTQYLMHWEEYGPNFFNAGPDLSFTTGQIAANYPKPTFTVNVPPTQHDADYPIVFWGFFPTGQTAYWQTATDLMGNVMWYFPGPLFVTRMETGGNLFSFPDDMTWREYDLAGNVLLETNVEIINEQLVRKGYAPINDFNIHETRRLPNGNLLLMGSLDEVSTMYQGGTQQDPVDIIGDMVLILDHNMQVVWAWNAFDHDNLSRVATLNDQCHQNQGGCPKFNKNFSVANDWLHSNAVEYLSDDGNLLLSERAQDYVIKINYQNGKGDGSILWRMGPYGDFTILNPPPILCGNPNVFPWFTHQHDATFQAPSKTQIGVEVMTVFDDGNLRNSQCGGGQNSRGMMMLVNQNQKTVSYVTVGDLGAYSSALGSADFLQTSGGLFTSYGNGFINLSEAESTELASPGSIVYQIHANSASYRTYRLQNLYTPTWP